MCRRSLREVEADADLRSRNNRQTELLEVHRWFSIVEFLSL
jgi:hypothetical protein